MSSVLSSSNLLFKNGGGSTLAKIAADSNQLTMSGAESGQVSLKNLASPLDANDAATKAYVDGLIQGLDIKPSVKVATHEPKTLATDFAEGKIIDDIPLVEGDRILIKDQDPPSENGIYTVNENGAPRA